MNVVWQKKADIQFIQSIGLELPCTAGITLEETDYGRIALGPSDELFQREFS